MKRKQKYLLFVIFFICKATAYASISDSTILFIIYDSLSDFSKIENRSTNLIIENSNEGNFNGDKARLVRTDVKNAYLVYQVDTIQDFYIDLWEVDSTGGGIRVYQATDGINFTEIQLKHTSPADFGYRFLRRFRPAEVLSDSVHYLKVELYGGLPGNGWKNQIGSVAIIYGKKQRKPQVFYVDSQFGSDENTGNTPGKAWASLSKINETLFFPGDTIMLKSGESFHGMLQPHGNGITNQPIVVTMYGGTELPVIDGKNRKACIHLLNAENWIISNLELENNGGDDPMDGSDIYRTGILVETNTLGVKHNIQLINLDIHHVYPVESTSNEVGPGVYKGYGIHFLANGQVENTRFENVRVESCKISYTAYYGILTQHLGKDPDHPEWNYNRNFIIRNCNIQKTGSAGMVIQHMDDLLVEYNTVSKPGSKEEPKQYGRGSGIWTWRSKNVVIQHNTFMHARGFTDSCGAHIDFGNRNVTIQYNLSYDNAGGFVEILGDCVNSIYRYNISINDGFRVAGKGGAWQDGKIIWIAAYNGKEAPPVGSTQSKIYNNTIYVGPGIKTNILFEKLTNNNYVENNIFYIEGDVTFADNGVNNLFNHNIYYGNVRGWPYGDQAIFADPMLRKPGGTNPADYLIQENSLAINTGDTLLGAGSRDFWGDTLHFTFPPDRGADETNIQQEFTTIHAQITSTGGDIYPSGNVRVPLNSDFPFKIIPKPGFRVKNVLVDGISVGKLDSYTFENVSTVHSIEVAFELPQDSVFDPLVDFVWVSDYSTNMALRVDNPENFSGDTSRMARTDTLDSFIEYFFFNIYDFQIEYWSWAWPGSGEIEVYGSEDGENYERIPVRFIEISQTGNRIFSKITPQFAMDDGIHYLKIEVSGGDADWKDQMGSVAISYMGNVVPATFQSNRADHVTVYPVPAQNELHIRGLNSNQEILVFDVHGKLCISKRIKNNDVLDISELPAGFYFIKLAGSDTALKFSKSFD